MAIYIFKRKYFGLAAGVGKTLNVLGGGSAKNVSTMNKVMGGMSVAGMASTASSGKAQRAEQEAQNQQALQEQKEKLNQLNNLAKS